MPIALGHCQSGKGNLPKSSQTARVPQTHISDIVPQHKLNTTLEAQIECNNGLVWDDFLVMENHQNVDLVPTWHKGQE
jgi:hypothetical protein